MTVELGRDFENKFLNKFGVVVVVDESLEETISKEDLSKYGMRLRDKTS